MKTVILILIHWLSLFALLNAQSTSSLLAFQSGENSKSINRSSDIDSLTFPRYGLNIGIAWMNGGNIGLRVMPTKEISFEVAYGGHIYNFVTPYSEDLRYTFGVNWHFTSNSRYAISFMNTIVYDWNDYSFKYYLIGPQIGYLNLCTQKFSFYVRAGFFLYIRKNPDKIQIIRIDPNLDLGISFVF